MPLYPPLAKAARISGSVPIEIIIDEEGEVMFARSLGGHPLLKESALAAARGWKFKPTLLQGEPVKVIGMITFNFQM
jgi:protein TonB